MLLYNINIKSTFSSIILLSNLTINKNTSKLSFLKINEDLFMYIKNMRHIIGYILLVLSCMAWLVIFVLPFLGLSGVQITTATTALVIVAEVLFWLSVILLGKEVIRKIKRYCFRKKSPNQS